MRFFDIGTEPGGRVHSAYVPPLDRPLRLPQQREAGDCAATAAEPDARGAARLVAAPKSPYPRLRFRRQHVLQGFIVDFYCPSLRLVLELDGAPHHAPAQMGYDAARTVWLEARGYRVRRVPNRDVSREALERLLRLFVRERETR